MTNVVQALSLELAYEGRGVRVVGSSDAPRFVVVDVCAVLGHSDPSKAVAGLDDDEKGTSIVPTLGGPQETLTVTEAGLYALIARSRKPAARKFDRWVRHDVLPCIRKHGTYPAGLSVAGDSRVVVYRDQEANQKLDHLIGEVGSIKTTLAEVRDISDRTLRLVSSKGRHDPDDADLHDYCRVILLHYAGRCPMCTKARVIKDDLSRTDDSRIEHWVRPTIGDRDKCWLVCNVCNAKLGPAGGTVQRSDYEADFKKFQRHLRELPPEQKKQPDNRAIRDLFDKIS